MEQRTACLAVLGSTIWLWSAAGTLDTTATNIAPHALTQTCNEWLVRDQPVSVGLSLTERWLTLVEIRL